MIDIEALKAVEALKGLNDAQLAAIRKISEKIQRLHGYSLSAEFSPEHPVGQMHGERDDDIIIGCVLCPLHQLVKKHGIAFNREMLSELKLQLAIAPVKFFHPAIEFFPRPQVG